VFGQRSTPFVVYGRIGAQQPTDRILLSRAMPDVGGYFVIKELLAIRPRGAVGTTRSGHSCYPNLLRPPLRKRDHLTQVSGLASKAAVAVRMRGLVASTYLDSIVHELPSPNLTSGTGRQDKSVSGTATPLNYCIAIALEL
jgi:hypothetical protein